MNILLFLGSTQGGGTQTQWLLLERELRALGHQVLLVGPRRIGALDRGPGRFFDLAVRTTLLRKTLHELDPDIIYSGLWTMNLCAWSATRLSRWSERLVWGVRALPHGPMSATQQHSQRLAIALSPSIPLVISNSNAAQYQLQELNFSPKSWAVVPNGIDTDLYHPNPQASLNTRQQLGLDAQTLVLGSVARLSPIKDHTTLLSAYALLLNQRPLLKKNSVLLLIGTGTEQERRRIEQHAHALHIHEQVRFLGARNDLLGIYNALDVHIMSSRAESLPNAVAEAMACACPSIATDVGDCRELINDAKLLAPAGDAEQLSHILLNLADDAPLRRQLGAKARKHIVDRYNPRSSAEQTVAAFQNLLEHLPTGHRKKEQQAR